MISIFFKLRLILLLAVSVIFNAQSFAKPSENKRTVLSETTLVSRSLEHYPTILNAIIDVQAGQIKTQGLRSVFDTKVNATSRDRLNGYYDGDYQSAKISKTLPFLNTNIYGGYRKGDGEFPIYEDKSNTLDNGETFLGVSIDLLKNSWIDQNRFDIKIQEEKVKQQEFSLLKNKLTVQTMALNAYWNWAISGEKLNVIQGLLKLSELRLNNINKRIKAGDLPKIYKFEIKQYIAKRKAELKKEEQNFINHSQILSLFNRSKIGKPMIPKRSELPPLSTPPRPKPYSKEDLQKVLRSHPDLLVLKSVKRNAETSFKFGKNQIFPELTLGLEHSKDRGAGPDSLMGTENIFMLNLSFSLEQRKARAIRNIGKLKLEQTENKINFLKEKIKTKLQSLNYKSLNSFDIIKITEEQIDLADKLSKAEFKKFKSGASDLILVNLRDESLAEAKIKYLMEHLNFHIILAELNMLTVTLIN